MINVGNNCFINENKVVAIVDCIPQMSSPVRRLLHQAQDSNKEINLTKGKKTNAIIVTSTSHIITTSMKAETVAKRVNDVRQNK